MNYAAFGRKINPLAAVPRPSFEPQQPLPQAVRPNLLVPYFQTYFMVGMENSAPSFTPDGQREVTVLVRV